ncbi:MAG: SRPBCC domain-containing protein [bacterium]
MGDQPLKGRWYEKKFEIRAPLADVWKAITEGEELTRWFCAEAKSAPGVGGETWISWGLGMDGTHVTTVWEPEVRLRTESSAEGQAARGMDPVPGDPYATEWFLEHENGVTKVRMVQSGFGEGDRWDGEYNGTFHGWDMFHRQLKHYVEHHFGQQAFNFNIMDAIALPKDQAWDAVAGPAILNFNGNATPLAVGVPLACTTGFGPKLAGEVWVYKQGTFCGILHSQGGALVELEMMDGGPGQTYLWFNYRTWGRDPATEEQFATDLRSAVATLPHAEAPAA